MRCCCGSAVAICRERLLRNTRLLLVHVDSQTCCCLWLFRRLFSLRVCVCVCARAHTQTHTSYLTDVLLEHRQISCITWKVHVFLPFSCKWISILYAFFVSLSSGKRKILSQNFIQRTAVRMKIGNLARSPSTIAFGVWKPTLRERERERERRCWSRLHVTLLSPQRGKVTLFHLTDP